jgi:hypothetical protein
MNAKQPDAHQNFDGLSRLEPRHYALFFNHIEWQNLGLGVAVR